MKKNTLVAAVTVVAVCLIAVAGVLGFKARKNNGVLNETAIESESTTVTTTTDPETTETTTEPVTLTQTTKEITTKASKIVTTIITMGNKESTAQAAVIDNATVPVLDEDSMSKGKASIEKPAADSPLAKDMTIAGLQSSGYNVTGLKGFIYNNDTDPNCMQKNFGYNVLYDAGASLIDFSIKTARFKFNYGGKAYMIQVWKGQYISGDIGTVGGEVGIYTRKENKVSAIGHYDCAKQDDWLNMEMTVLWDEKGDGNYLPQFTRKYALHWWETGYVDGQLANKKDSSPLRILCRMTMKDEEQAIAFANALAAEGMTEVQTFNPTVKDTFKRQGKDIIFIWQNVR